MISKIVHISFDAAGTLFAVRDSVGQQYARVARKYGLSGDPQQLETSFRQAFQSAPPLTFPNLIGDRAKLIQAEKNWWSSIVSAVFSTQFADTEIFERFFDELYAHFSSKEAWEVYPEVVPTLERLKNEHFELGVVSNFDSRLHSLLEAFNLSGFFSRVVCSSEVGVAKPNREIFLKHLPRGHAFHQILHIGDQLKLDVEPVAALGMQALWLDRKSLPNRGNSLQFQRIGRLDEIFAYL